MEHGLFSDAAGELKKLPAEIRKELQVVNLLAVNLLKTGDNRGALSVLEHAAADMNGTGEHQLAARYLSAKAYMAVKEKEKARRILLRLERDSPGYEDTPQLLEQI
jgi:thioredoxin-like negative regulator of GroEL